MELRKGKIVIASLMIVGTILSVGCFGENRENLPQFVIGCDNYEPYNYTDEDGEPAGIDVDLAREACKRIGYEPVFRYIDWSKRDIYLENDKVDCLWSCYPMDNESNYEWVGPYMYSRQVVVVTENSTIHKISDLNEKSVAVRVGGCAEDIFLKRTDDNVPRVKNLYSLNNVDEIVTALRNNYVDACAGYSATITVLLNNAEVPYRFLDEDLSRADLGIAFKKNGDTKIRKELEEVLKEMRKDGTTERILKSYGLDADKALGEKESE